MCGRLHWRSQYCKNRREGTNKRERRDDRDGRDPPTHLGCFGAISLRAGCYGAISLRARRYGSTSSACARVLRRDEKGVSAEADRYDREEAGAEARHYERGGA